MDKRLDAVKKYLSKEKNIKKIIEKELKDEQEFADELKKSVMESITRFEPDENMLDEYEEYLREQEHSEADKKKESEDDEKIEEKNIEDDVIEIKWDKNTVKEFVTSVIRNQLNMFSTMLKTQKRYKEMEEKAKELKEELFRTETQLKEYIDLASRLKKDYENLARRSEKERKELEENASMKVCNTVVEIMDNFELVLKDLQKKEDEKVDREKVLEGLMKVERKFQNILGKEGVNEIESVNSEFDHNFHEAIVCEESQDIDVDELVVEEFRKGYMFKDRLLRPALVKVLKKTKSKENK